MTHAPFAAETLHHEQRNGCTISKCRNAPRPAVSMHHPVRRIHMGQVGFPLPEPDFYPTPRCGDCTIAFRNCKSFLSKINCRRTASFNPAQRQLTIRNNQINISGEISIIMPSTIPLPEVPISLPQSTPARSYSYAESCTAKSADAPLELVC